MNFDTKKYEGGIIDEYIKFFGYKIYHKTKLLEIGTLKNGFIKFCSEYWLENESSFVVGVDENPTPCNNNNVKMYKCNQSNTQKLIEIAMSHYPFDIIIDDASHKYDNTLNCFEVLWPFLINGGYYIIEDWTVIGREEKLVYKITENMVKYGIEECRIIRKGLKKYDKNNPFLAIAFFKKKENYEHMD